MKEQEIRGHASCGKAGSRLGKATPPNRGGVNSLKASMLKRRLHDSRKLEQEKGGKVEKLVVDLTVCLKW